MTIDDKLKKVIEDLDAVVVEKDDWNLTTIKIHYENVEKYITIFYKFDELGNLHLHHRYYNKTINQLITSNDILNLSKLNSVNGLKTIIIDFVYNCLHFDFNT